MLGKIGQRLPDVFALFRPLPLRQDRGGGSRRGCGLGAAADAGDGLLQLPVVKGLEQVVRSAQLQRADWA